MRFAVIILLLGGILAGGPARSAEGLARGAAITDPLALRELDHGRFGLDRVMQPTSSADGPITNGKLFALPSMAPVRSALDGEFDRYVVAHKAALPGQTIGVGSAYDVQLFDRARLYSDDARFVLSGIVNRMDRGYLSEANCGEIRLIYRLTRTGPVPAGDSVTSRRLPMTLNVVFKARGDDAVARGGDAITCAEIARRWLATADLPVSGVALAEKLLAEDGALAPIGPDDIDRIETNLQLSYAPKSPDHDFRTDYLLKVFRYNAQTKTFGEVPLENQIDRARILADQDLKRAFKAWLLDPGHLGEFDRGTVLIPQEFLAAAAIAPTPAGFAASPLQPAFGMVQGDGQADEAAGDPVFSDHDIVAALENAEQHGVRLQNIRSAAGFERRLNDITCAGCHQTRGIGGFHFPGVDWIAADPSGSLAVPASPHFFGDQIRRRDILLALRDGRAPDYSRGFSSRPQRRGSTELAGTEYDDGWGAHCYRPQAGPADNDASFRSWTCAAGLSCQPVDPASRIGMCLVQSR